MSSPIIVDLFAEDQAHEEFLTGKADASLKHFLEELVTRLKSS